MNYLVTVFRLLISMGFVMIITRRLSVEEFGLWALIGSLISYPLVPIGLWTYWCPRSIARNVPRSFGTGLTITFTYLPIALVTYCAIAYVMYLQVIGWGFESMLLYGSVLLIVSLISSFFTSLPGAIAPEVYGYSGLVHEILRLPLAYIFVVVLRFGVNGAIMALALSYSFSCTVNVALLRRRGVRWDGFDSSLAKKWFKGFSIPIIDVVSGFLGSSDRVLLACISGSEVPVAYMSASYSLRNPIAYGGATVSGLYAKMLRGGSASDVEEVSRLYFAITTFTFITVICLAHPLMSLLNPAYRDAYWIVFIAGVLAILQGTIGIFGTVVVGREEVDLKPEVSVKDYVKSRLFKWSSTGAMSQIVSLVVGSTLLVAFMPLNNVILLASAYPIGWLAGTCIFLLRYYRMAKSSLQFKFPWRDIAPFVIAGLCSGVCYQLLGSYSITVEAFWRDMPILLVHVVVAALIYFAISYALSPWFRDFLRAAKRFVLEEVFCFERTS
ncbi:MAG: hypothetical protein QW701_04060 [Candidatus Nezhaarchaeales archaeon]